MHEYAVVTAPQTIRIERLLPGPIERVWDYLVDSERRASWLAVGPLDARAGGTVQLEFRNASLSKRDDRAPAKYAAVENSATLRGRVLACEPPHLLAFTWGDAPGDSQVRFELRPEGTQVRLTVTHSQLADRDALLSVSGGWHTHLDILRDRLAGVAPASFWATHTRLEAEYARRIA